MEQVRLANTRKPGSGPNPPRPFQSPAFSLKRGIPAPTRRREPRDQRLRTPSATIGSLEQEPTQRWVGDAPMRRPIEGYGAHTIAHLLSRHGPPTHSNRHTGTRSATHGLRQQVHRDRVERPAPRPHANNQGKRYELGAEGRANRDADSCGAANLFSPPCRVYFDLLCRR